MSLLLSVCVFAYNHEAYIAQAIDSVLSQRTNFDFEILVGEDGSSDTTCDILERYKQNNPDKIRVLYQEQSKKIYINGNPTGRFNFINTLQNCKGKYIALLDGDDYWTDSLKLQKQVDYMEYRQDVSLCFHSVKRIRESGEEEVRPLLGNKIREYKIEELLRYNCIPTGSVVFRNLYAWSLPKSYYSVPMGDWPLWTVFATKGKLMFMPDCMGVYRYHGGGIWTNSQELYRLKAMVLYFDFSFSVLNKSYCDKIYCQQRMVLDNLIELSLLQKNREVLKWAKQKLLRNKVGNRLRKLLILFNTLFIRSAQVR